MEALRERITQEPGDGVGVDTVLAGLDAMVVDRLRHRPGKPLSARRRELTSYALAPFADGAAGGGRRERRDGARSSADRARIALLLDRGPEAQADFELLVQGAVARRDGPTLWHVSVAMAERRAAGEPVPEAVARQALEGLQDAWFFGLPVEASSARPEPIRSPNEGARYTES